MNWAPFSTIAVFSCLIFLSVVQIGYYSFLPVLVTIDNGNEARGNIHQTTCQPAVVGELFNHECRPDEIEWERKRICITHVKKNCIENVSPDLVEMIAKFTSNQPEVFCSELIDVGEGDPDYDPSVGQYPYKLCKQWLPNPNSCIVYSFGYTTTLKYYA